MTARQKKARCHYLKHAERHRAYLAAHRGLPVVVNLPPNAKPMPSRAPVRSTSCPDVLQCLAVAVAGTWRGMSCEKCPRMGGGLQSKDYLASGWSDAAYPAPPEPFPRKRAA